MYAAARKLHIIEAVLKTDNEAVLKAIETIVDQDNASASKRTKGRFSDLLGVMTEQEANEMKHVIEEGCEQIHPDDWK